MTELIVTADDHRRAAALIVHNARDDNDGTVALLTEAAEAGRATELIFALLDVYQQLVPELRTELGIRLLSAHVVRLAGLSDA